MAQCVTMFKRSPDQMVTILQTTFLRRIFMNGNVSTGVHISNNVYISVCQIDYKLTLIHIMFWRRIDSRHNLNL